MRIAVSNPDNIGDFVVRQPMLAALVEAGHEVLLIVRTHVAPVAAWCLPGARIVQCAGDPYAPKFELSDPPDDQLVAAVQSFDPDVYVVAAYQHTQLEEQMAGRIPRAKVFGFGGELRQNDSSLGRTHVSGLQFTVRVAVGRDWPEARKNELLCGAILGGSVQLGAPKLTAERRFVEAASGRLRREGLRKRKYWVVCAGEGSEYTRLKNWTIEKWAELCSVLVKEHGLHLLFVGTEAEHETTAAIRSQMGALAENTLDLTANPDGLDMLIGLLALSSGYLGKDTGPMHLAASLGKPVVAVFGGGHWPRFLPAAEMGKVITMQVPCTDCDWICPYKTSHCVKDVPVEAVLAAVRGILDGKQAGFEALLLEPEPWIARAMAREAAETAREAVQALTVERSNFHQWHTDRVTDIEGLRQQVAVLETQKSEFAGERQGWTEAIRQVRDDAAKLVAERLELEAALGARAEEVARMAELSAAASVEMDLVRRELVSLRMAVDAKRLVELRFARFRERTVRRIAESQSRTAALREETAQAVAAAAVAEESRVDLRKQLDELLIAGATLEREKARIDVECAERTAALDVATAKLDLLESRYQGTIADLQQQLRRTELNLHSVLALVPDLRTELTQGLGEIGRLQETLAAMRATAARVPELEQECAERLERIETLTGTLEEVEADRARRLELIELMAQQMEELEADRALRLELIESGSLRTRELEEDQAAKQTLIDELSGTIAAVERDRAERLRVIEASALRVRELEKDQSAKQELIERLSADLARVEAARAEALAATEAVREEALAATEAVREDLRQVDQDRMEKQRVIEQITESVNAIEADRAARLRSIEALTAQLREVEADQRAKQALIEKLSAMLSEVEADRADRGRQIEILSRTVREREAEIVALQASLSLRMTKWMRRG